MRDATPAELETIDASEVQTDLEVSANHHVDDYGVHTEYEIHTGFANPYFVTEATVDRVESQLGIDLRSADYQSGAEIRIVPADAEVPA